jgi:hypothetical protein
MTRQRPSTSLLEAATQAAVSLPIGFVVVFGVERMQLGPMASAATITLAMFLLSVLRGYVIRRRFERRRS